MDFWDLTQNFFLYFPFGKEDQVPVNFMRLGQRTRFFSFVYKKVGLKRWMNKVSRKRLKFKNVVRHNFHKFKKSNSQKGRLHVFGKYPLFL